MFARIVITVWALALVALPAGAQQKQRIDKAADLPRFSYKLDASLEQTVRDPVLFAAFANQFQRDTQSVLTDYAIDDKATLRQLLIRHK